MKKNLILNIICAIFLLFAQNAHANKVNLHFALAASLKPVFEAEIIPLFKKENPNINIVPVYDSSGRLEMQIKEGLNVDFFFSAAPIHIKNLVAKKIINQEDFIAVLTNKLVLIQSANSHEIIEDLKKIRTVNNIAIGNPKSAPVGYYSEQALEALGHYRFIRKKLSLAQNVTEIMAWVASGSADVGIVYASDARNVNNIKVVLEIPYDNNDIRYFAAVLSATKYKDEMASFMQLLQSDKLKKIFDEYGFIAL